MKEKLKLLWIYISMIRCIFHLAFYIVSRNKKIIDRDLEVWAFQYQLKYNTLLNFVYLLVWHREFRNLLYYRLKPYHHFLNLLFPRLPTLYLNAKYIGPGFFIQHGDSSRINGEYIGANCWVNQLVTIAYSNRTDRPILQDGVKVHVGAIILGKVTIGENAIIGAGAVIVKDVPPNCTVIGTYPAYIVRENGQRVKKEL
jgi:serine O-acetyltransferase